MPQKLDSSGSTKAKFVAILLAMRFFKAKGKFQKGEFLSNLGYASARLNFKKGRQGEKKNRKFKSNPQPPSSLRRSILNLKGIELKSKTKVYLPKPGSRS